MIIARIFLLFSTLMLKNINGAISFDTNAYALAHPCNWSICEDSPTEQLNYTITCCTLQVPLNYAKPNQSSISIFMVRFSPLNPTNNFLFTLAGGPGESVLNTINVVLSLIPAEYGITIIGPDHRGTGLSTPLGCDDQNSQDVTMDCITYLKNRWTIEGLNQFSTTSAAHDLAIQIQAAQLNGRISVLGISYGTYWLNRFLTIYPNLVQSAIMDSPVNPLLHAFSMYNVRASSVALQFLSYCHYQVECIQHFPNGSPVTMLYKILQEMDTNKQKCINTYFSKYNLTSQKIKTRFFLILQSPRTDATVIPAVIFRLNRCNKEDVTALDFYFKTQSSSSPSSNESPSRDTHQLVSFSRALNKNIAFSELWLYLNQSDVDQETLNAWQNSTIIGGDPETDEVALRKAWPKYSLDEYRYLLANSSVLMLAGQLDSATSLDFASHLASITGKTRTLYTIPLCEHVILIFVISTGYTCPLHLILSWAFPTLFPSEWSDPTCIKDLPTTIDFVGATELGRASSLKFFNVSLPFGNTNTSETGNRASSSDYSMMSFIFILLLIYFFDIQWNHF